MINYFGVQEGLACVVGTGDGVTAHESVSARGVQYLSYFTKLKIFHFVSARSTSGNFTTVWAMSSKNTVNFFFLSCLHCLIYHEMQ
jgi:hypothetical protein